jgi:monovalent cation:H+ antiporter-2, CPA2 family
VDAGPITFSGEVVEIGAQVGLVLLLFMLGLDYAGHELGARVRGSLGAGAFDLLANFVPGFASGLLLGWSPLAAFVLGGVTYISSSGLVAKMISDYGRSEHPETRIVLAVLVIEDLVMAAYLPVLAVLVTGAGLVAAGLSLALAAGFAALALVLAVRWGHHVTRALSPRSEEVFLLTVLGFALLVGGLAEEALSSAAVGAFLAGIALSGPVVERARGMLTPLRDVFAAGFFVFFGLQVDLEAVVPVAPAVLALATVTALTKFWTGWRAATGAAASRDGRLRAGTALIARGEFSIVIAGIGVTAGLEPELGALAGGYVLVTALGASLLTRAVEGRTARGTVD